MKGYLINAHFRTIDEMEWEYDTLSVHFPLGGPTLGFVFENGDVLYVDDAGLLYPASCAFRIKKRRDGQPMMSNGFLTGGDTHKMVEGELVESTADPQFTIEQLKEEIEWLTVEEAMEWFYAHRHEAAVTINGETVTTWEQMIQNLLP